MDGLTILKKARATKVSAPVLMLTAMGGLDDKVDGLEAGADDYLAKPFAMRELVARLHALLLQALTSDGCGGKQPNSLRGCNIRL